MVRSLEKLPGVHRVYNMTLEEDHVYRVSLLGVLVHNQECDGDDLPILEISREKYKQLAANIENAQKAGHPDVLTHAVGGTGNRAKAMKALPNASDEIPIIDGLSRDEYPFNSTLEGGEGAWIGHLPTDPLDQNKAGGGLLRNFLRRNQIQIGDQYRVKVVE